MSPIPPQLRENVRRLFFYFEIVEIWQFFCELTSVAHFFLFRGFFYNIVKGLPLVSVPGSGRNNYETIDLRSTPGKLLRTYLRFFIIAGRSSNLFHSDSNDVCVSQKDRLIGTLLFSSRQQETKASILSYAYPFNHL